MKGHGSGRGEVVVITGASAGVGRATALAFAKQGAHIGLVARGRERLQAAQREAQALGGHALVFPADVSHADQMEAAADAVEKELGPSDIWVNKAMTSVLSPFYELSPDEFERVTQVTYLGYVYGTMAALRRMRPRDHRTGRFGTRVPRHSAPVGLLRRPTRDPGLYRVGAHRAVE